MDGVKVRSSNSGTAERAVGRRIRGGGRRRAPRALLAGCVTLLTCAVAGAGAAGGAGPAAATTGPVCSFSGSILGTPLVTNVTPGKVIDISCTGLPASTSFVLVEASLLVAVDPSAKPLLTGTSVTTLPGLLALISATPELNATSIPLPLPSSNASGDLTTTYTVPSTQPTDPNAKCPPTTEQLNSGLVGCAVAMINATTFKPVTAGTFVLSYKGQPVFPPDPTLALSATEQPHSHVKTVTVSDAPGATTYWWLATLESIEAGLGGGSGGGPVPVVVKVGRSTVASKAFVTPASYNGATFTPPKLSGSFVVGKSARGKVTVSLPALLLGLPLTISAKQKMPVAPLVKSAPAHRR